MTEPGAGKIFPRNLTARADYVVRGNPANSRPESGVDNCFPGLEFDQRNLEAAFFPGLRFEFHRTEGAILRRVLPGSTAETAGITDRDRNLYLWAIVGRTTVQQSADDPPVFFTADLIGLDVWRHVHDLLPGPVAILLGDRSGPTATPTVQDTQGFNESVATGQSRVLRRTGDGRVATAALVAERSGYLDEDGVIEADDYQPGELTRTLCAPWQYDFTECGCFYWAASKPDMVTSADGEHRYVNFQRSDRGDPPPQDIADYAERGRLELQHERVIKEWNTLAVVLGDRETEEPLALPQFEGDLWGPDRVRDELRRLATVEHALCVEYLYAHYSIDAPVRLAPAEANTQRRRIFAAANEVFAVAVDEMRHLRWVNEALSMLGAAPVLGRATEFGSNFDDREFRLAPLTAEQLQWFVDVEAPSQSVGGQGLDGMYVRLHTSVARQPELFDSFDPERRLAHLLKLIIDEGQDHYERFRSVQRHLAGLGPDDYLRELADPPAGDFRSGLQRLSDQNYAVLIGALQTTFTLGDRAGGTLLAQSIRAMRNLHEINHLLAANGVRPPFTAPEPPAQPLATAARARAFTDSLADSTRAILTDVGGSPDPDVAAAAQRQRPITDDLFDALRRGIDDGLRG